MKSKLPITPEDLVVLSFPEPVVRYVPNDLWLEFPFSPSYLKDLRGENNREGAVKKTSGKSSGKTTDKIMALMMKDASITIPKLAVRIAVTERSVERNIKKLQSLGRVRRIGPAGGGHWEVKGKP